MTQPSGPILGAVHLDDGVSTRFRWNEEVGIAGPAGRPMGSIQETFGGAVRVLPTAIAYPARDLDLPGYLLQVNGLAESYDRLARLYDLAGSPGSTSILQMGAVGLRVIPDRPVVEKLKAHRLTTDYSMKATAVPANWIALAGSLEGQTFGMSVNGETMNHTSGGATRPVDVFALAAGGQPSVTNPGTAPTPLVLTISVSGPRTTRFYVRTTAPGYTKRISVTPTAGGTVSITEKDGLIVPPGTCALRYEEASGAIIAGTIASSIYGTRWRYEGLDDALSAADPLILYNTRQQRAYYAIAAFTTSAGLRTAHPDQPRFGNSGTYSATTAGLVVEPDRTNLVLQSQALATAPWVATMVTATNNNSTAPDGASTSTRLQITAGMAGTLAQGGITLTAAPYVVSFYARSTSAGAQTFTVAMGAILASTIVTTGTNWARYQYLVTGTAAAYSLTFANDGANAADVQIWGVQVELATGQTAANATSYISTTSTTQRRFPDVVGVRKVENLLAWSNRFEKTTAVSGTRGLWYVSGAAVTTATRQIGPSGVTDASSVVLAAGQYIEQNLLNAENTSSKTVEISLWVRNSSATPSSNATLRLVDGAGGFTEVAISNLDDNWQRVSVQRLMPANNTACYLNFRGTGAITCYFAHAQATIVSDGTYNLASATAAAVSAPYVETFAAPMYADETWSWPKWLTQNGYLEADICFGETANPNSSARVILGAYNSDANPSMWPGAVYRSPSFGSADNSITFAKGNNLGTSSASYAPSSSVYDGAFHKFRVEWVNYTISGSRTIRVYLYIDGVSVSNATTASASTWLEPPTMTVAGQASAAAWHTLKNIVIGSPSLPAGAVPEPY